MKLKIEHLFEKDVFFLDPCLFQGVCLVNEPPSILSSTGFHQGIFIPTKPTFSLGVAPSYSGRLRGRSGRAFFGDGILVIEIKQVTTWVTNLCI